APRSPERPSRHGSGSALSATGNRLGCTPDPHRCNTDGLRPPANRVAACSVQENLNENLARVIDQNALEIIFAAGIQHEPPRESWRLNFLRKR
ncbi:hypothetical protein SK432_25860, partial [Escherichia coli]